MVAYHVIGESLTSGLRVDDESWWRFFGNIFMYLRMPLFAFISGYVYAIYKIDKKDYPKFYGNKIRRLGLPLISVATLFFAASHLAGTKYALPFDKIYIIYMMPYAHYWYLQASLIIFLIISILEKFSLIETKQRTFVFFIATVLLSATSPNLQPDIFSINGAIFLMPYFALGLYIRRYKLSLSQKEASIATITAACMLSYAIFVHLKILPTPVFLLDKTSSFGILLSLCLCISLYSSQWKNKWLAAIGTHSFAIYLFHIFATSGSRMGLIKSDPDMPLFLVFAAGMISGIAFPILLEMLIVKNRFLNFILLGARLKKKDSQLARSF